jgi:hypothetical protein
MNIISRHYVHFISVCFIFISCTKTNNNSINHTGPDIYIAGDNGTSPVLWKNGNAQILTSTTGSANKVVLSGNDVYVAGIEALVNDLTPAGPTGQFVYWKNGIENKIGNLRFIQFSSSASIAVSGMDVYYSNSYCWKNGAQITLAGQSLIGIQSCFSTGTDIYFLGYDSLYNAVYWKNGKLNIIASESPSQSGPAAICIYALGNNVYVGGSMSNNALYWENGTAHYLQTTASGSSVSYTSSIFVSGQDVYTTGPLFVQTNAGINIPAYWKNGIEQDLPLNGATHGYTSSIFVSGSDVYVAGNTSLGAVYWKNGTEHILSSSGTANSIYVR